LVSPIKELTFSLQPLGWLVGGKGEVEGGAFS